MGLIARTRYRPGVFTMKSRRAGTATTVPTEMTVKRTWKVRMPYTWQGRNDQVQELKRFDRKDVQNVTVFKYQDRSLQTVPLDVPVDRTWKLGMPHT